MFLVLLAAARLLFVEAQPLCTYAYSPCDPQDVNTGICLDAPGEQCYADQSNIVYCCVPEPTTAAPVVTTAPPAPTAGPCVQPTTTAPTFSGTCADVLSCCSTSLCSQYRTEMLRLCPLTCGFCTPPSVPSPSPVSLKGCSDSMTSCRSIAAQCFATAYMANMKQLCTYTCGYCSPCADNSNKCGEWAKNGFCTSSYYTIDEIRSFCAYTCGYCGNGAPPVNVAPVVPPCVDSDSKCATYLKNGFCSSPYYTAAEKKQYCAKSCNLC